jgi:hypothetical protein
MPVLTVGSTEIDYVLRRSDAATRARITVTPAAVEVVVPAAATDDEIVAVLHRRRGWLFEQTRHIAELSATSPVVVRFVSGAKAPYPGPLHAVAGGAVRQHAGRGLFPQWLRGRVPPSGARSSPRRLDRGCVAILVPQAAS